MIATSEFWGALIITLIVFNIMPDIKLPLLLTIILSIAIPQVCIAFIISLVVRILNKAILGY